MIPSKLGLCCRCPTDALSEPYRDADKQYSKNLCFIRHTFVFKAYGVFQSIVTCRALLFGNFYPSLILVLSQFTYPVLISQLLHHLSSPSQRASLTPSMPPMTTDMDEPQNSMRTGFLDLPYELRYEVYCYFIPRRRHINVNCVSVFLERTTILIQGISFCIRISAQISYDCQSKSVKNV